MHVYIYICMYVCMYACMHVCMYACMHVCMYACMHVCMYVCTYKQKQEYILISLVVPSSLSPKWPLRPQNCLNLLRIRIHDYSLHRLQFGSQFKHTSKKRLPANWPQSWLEPVSLVADPRMEPIETIHTYVRQVGCRSDKGLKMKSSPTSCNFNFITS